MNWSNKTAEELDARTCTTMILEGTKLPAFRSLLASTVDYAGLFPPAALALEPALQRYQKARRGHDRWMLGSFVVSRSRLVELEEIARPFLPAVGDGDPWSLSVVLDDDSGDLAAEFDALRERSQGCLQVAAVEVPPKPVDEVPLLAARMPEDVVPFFEVPLDEGMERRIAAIAASGSEAKVRLGGVVARAFPSVGAVSSFLLACNNLGVPFKATAGLHHPMRGPQAITYDEDSPSTWMHGFLNLILASVFLAVGAIGDNELVEVLSESEGSAFRFSHRRIVWRDREVTVEQIERARRSFFSSFGSCSIDEPLADLERLGLLSRQSLFSQG